ncbi:Hsp20/alpha crystallin family protein [Halorussus amylolyticus]|uniref:Hsp20/alpha crystallin family protein n=1 Tax=Halorussus amylolyticus TaxID=1126242 RepID=UPI0010495236|nr:Hsp20/alpha crystallin family protein [Halorussus amylolyticus]
MTRYDPFEEMDRMLDQFRTRMWNADRPFGGLDVPARGRSDISMDLDKRDDEYVFVADLPGFETDEIDLTFDNGTLVLAAEHELDDETGDEMTDDAAQFHRSRRVAERVTLPAEVVADEITASYRNGVLEVHLPLLEAEDEDDETKISIED